MDNIADTLIRIKNGYSVSKPKVSVRYSKLILSICKLLVTEGYLESCKQSGNEIEVILKYNNRKPAVADVKRISKPGLRIYKGSNNLPKVLNGLGIAIISTPKGVLTDRAAREQKVGGEILAEIW